MLNYVWLALILLGFASAVYLDVSDISSNKFRNNDQLECSVEYSEKFQNEQSFDTKILISKNSYQKFYNPSVENDLVIPVNSQEQTRKI